jgi:hypothetical protein
MIWINKTLVSVEKYPLRGIDKRLSVDWMRVTTRMRTWGTDRSDKERGGRRNEEDEDDDLV